MAEVEKVKVPNIGGATDVDVIEVMVKAGDEVEAQQSIVTLESDKASMEVPSPSGGKVEAVEVKVGDKVSEGDLLLTLQSTTSDSSQSTPSRSTEDKSQHNQAGEVSSDTQSSQSSQRASKSSQTITVPNIGGATDVDVIEVMVRVGDVIHEEQSVITLESDKASMEVPSPVVGEITAVLVSVGDKVSEGDAILTVSETSKQQSTDEQPTAQQTDGTTEEKIPATDQSSIDLAEDEDDDEGDVHAGPGVRRLAHEFGIDLKRISGSGQKGRIIKQDLQQYVKKHLQQGNGVTGLSIASAPEVDFSKFGEVSVKPLNKIQKLSGSALHRNWVSIPHVTQFGEADITELEAFRAKQKAMAEKRNIKLTPLAFLMKAAVAALKEFPKFNSSLDSSGESLVFKNYFNIGVAVDTPNGLVVPVIREVDKKGLFELAQELAEVSEKARSTGLGLADMQGGCFSISSLGGIGGTAFTPIINAPEVAILGVSRSYHKPVYQQDKSFQARLMLPLSLSYDHRVIDGADGARFMVYFANCLADIRTLLL